MALVKLDHGERAEYTLFAQPSRRWPQHELARSNALRDIVESVVPAEGIEPTA
jgi:hypothetical protein